MNNKLLKQKEQEYFVLKPSETLIENWQLWIAKEIVCQFKSGKAPKLQFNEFISLINLTKTNGLEENFKQFESQLLETKQKYPLLKDLDDINNELEKIYSKVISDKLTILSSESKAMHCSLLQKSLTKDIQQSSPEHLMSLLKNISKVFLIQKREYETNKIDLNNKKESATRACQILYNSNRCELNEESIWNALALRYRFQFEIDTNVMLSQLNSYSIQLIQSYYDSAKKALALLEQLEAYLNQKCSLQLTSIPIFTYLNKIDINHQQKLITLWIGQGINCWGDNQISVQQLKNKIFENTDSLVREIFDDYQYALIKNITIEKLP